MPSDTLKLSVGHPDSRKGILHNCDIDDVELFGARPEKTSER